MSMRWQDRLMLKMMTNKLVIKIFSIPIVLKVMMWETNVFLSIMSLFKGKKAEGVKADEAQTEGKTTGEGKAEGEKTDEEKPEE